MKPKSIAVTITVVLCMTAIECVALYKGIDGKLLTFFMAALAGIAGFTLPVDLIKSIMGRIIKK